MFLQMLEIMPPMKEVCKESNDEMWELISQTAFLSWLKLSVYMAIVSVAIVLSFHLKSEPTALGMLEPSLPIVEERADIL